MKRILLVTVCFVVASAVGGCNTFRGVGKDIERAGEGIQNATQ